MSWREALLEYSRAHKRQVWEFAEGIGIEFSDGCDAFWILPGEPSSTVPLPDPEAVQPTDLLALYHRIDNLRTRALQVVRHHLADRDVRVNRNRNGTWDLGLPGSTTSLDVGTYLTTVARDTGDLQAVLEAAFKDSWLGEPPTPDRIDEYLKLEGAPANERGYGNDWAPAPLVAETVRGALAWMGLCKALERVDAGTTPERLAEAAQPKGRIGRAMLQLADRLPEAKASIDLLKPGILAIEFEDEYPGDFAIDLRSRELAHRIAGSTPEEVGEELATEFLHLKNGRAAVFGAIHQAAAERGWSREKSGALFGAEALVYLGGEKREISFDPHSLMERIGRHGARDAVRLTFAAHPEFRQECLAALENPGPNAEEIKLADTTLRPRALPPPPVLRRLDSQLVARLDEFSEEALRKFLSGERTIWEYRNRAVFDPAVDTWADTADWVRMAERLVDGDYPDAVAVLILLEAGDTRGEEAASRYLAHAQPYDLGDSDVELVWRYRHSHSELAREWFAPNSTEDVPFAEERAKVGDPVAIRKQTLLAAELSDDDPRPDLVPFWDSGRQEKLHTDVLNWAREDYRFSPPDADKLSIALKLGWRDVAEALEENPYLLNGLLCIDRRGDQFDEPGILMSKEFLLAWSRLAPSPFLAQLVATAFATNLVALAEEASRRSAIGKPDVAAAIPSSLDIYREWNKELQPAFAIAWRRCRTAGAAAGH